MPSRRVLLSAAVSSMVVPLSGCVSSLLPRDHPILDCIEIVNVDTRPHTVHLRVDYEGEEVLSDSYSIDAREESGSPTQRWVPREWPTESGRFRVHVRMDGDSEWVTIDSEEEAGEYAIHIVYRIGPDGNGIPKWRTVDADDYQESCDESIATH